LWSMVDFSRSRQMTAFAFTKDGASDRYTLHFYRIDSGNGAGNAQSVSPTDFISEITDRSLRVYPKASEVHIKLSIKSDKLAAQDGTSRHKYVAYSSICPIVAPLPMQDWACLLSL
jgi:hypothetical protein